MKKLTYEQVDKNLARIAKPTVLYNLFKENEQLIDLVTMAIVNSINECIEEESYAGKNVKFRQGTRLEIIGVRSCTFAQGAAAKCLVDNGETIEVESPRGDSYTTEKRLVYLCEDQ